VPGGWHTQPEMAGAGLWSTPADLVRLEREIGRATAGESALPPDLAAALTILQVRRGDEPLRWSHMGPEQGKRGSYSAMYGPPETRTQTRVARR